MEDKQFTNLETLQQVLEELDTFVLTPAMEPFVDAIMDEMDEDADLQLTLSNLSPDEEEDYYDMEFNRRLAVAMMLKYGSFAVKSNNLYGIKDGNEELLSALI